MSYTSRAGDSPVLRDRWADGGPSLGAWCCLADAAVAEILARQGFDWVCVDVQHGLASEATLPGMLAAVSAAGVPGIVRVRWNTPSDIGWALDVGAQGVIVPMVDTAADAARAVAACRYPPAGTRSYGPVRPAFADARGDLAEINRRVVCAVMIETAAAVAQVEEIAAVPGVDALFVGPSDLAVALGVEPGAAARASQVFQDATARVVRACQDNGIVAGIYAGGPEVTKYWGARGFRMMTLHSDTGLLEESAADVVARARG